MQIPYWYDSTSLTAHCRAADRLREAAHEHRIAAASHPPVRVLLAAIGRGCVRAGERLQRIAQPTEPMMRTFAKEHVQ
jgi:hypothetical protein